MTIKLYINNSENIRASKNIVELGTYTGTLREECSVEEPVILMELPASVGGSVNYMYIEEFHKYYFVSKDVVNNNLYRLSGTEDYLSTWISQLNECTGLCIRNEEDTNYFLEDSERVEYADNHYLIRNFPASFSDEANGGSIILITV